MSPSLPGFIFTLLFNTAKSHIVFEYETNITGVKAWIDKLFYTLFTILTPNTGEIGYCHLAI